MYKLLASKVVKPAAFLVAFTLIASAITGCKLVKNEETSSSQNSTKNIGTDLASIVEKTYSSKLVPLINEKALDVATLRNAISTDITAAGKAHGNRGAGAGSAWNFAVKGSGVIVSANLKSSKRKAKIDTNGDGKTDVSLQLGPVIKGTVLRDYAPFYDFGDFRDQIEFARLGRKLNDRLKKEISIEGSSEDLIGKNISFKGVFALKKSSDAWVVTVVSIKVQP